MKKKRKLSGRIKSMVGMMGYAPDGSTVLARTYWKADKLVGVDIFIMEKRTHDPIASWKFRGTQW